MNYTSSQSYHTLTHWQSNSPSSPREEVIVPLEVSCYHKGNTLYVNTIYKPQGFIDNLKPDYPFNDTPMGERFLPYKKIEQPTSIKYVEKVNNNGQIWYFILANEQLDCGVKMPINIEKATNEITLEGKNWVYPETAQNYTVNVDTVSADTTFDEMGLKLNLYSIYVASEWTGQVDKETKTDQTIIEDSNFDDTKGCKYVYLRIVDIETWKEVWKSSLLDVIGYAKVPIDTYTNASSFGPNEVSNAMFEISGAQQIDGDWYGGLGAYYRPDDPYTAYRSAPNITAVNIWPNRQRAILAPLSSVLWGNYIAGWSR